MEIGFGEEFGFGNYLRSSSLFLRALGRCVFGIRLRLQRPQCNNILVYTHMCSNRCKNIFISTFVRHIGTTQSTNNMRANTFIIYKQKTITFTHYPPEPTGESLFEKHVLPASARIQGWMQCKVPKYTKPKSSHDEAIMCKP